MTFETTGGFENTYISDTISLAESPLAGTWDFVLRGQTSTVWSAPVAGTGAVMVDSLALGAPKGAWILSNRPGTVHTLWFYKTADGTVDHAMATGNDFRVMEARVCRRLRGDVFCGGIADSAWGY